MCIVDSSDEEHKSSANKYLITVKKRNKFKCPTCSKLVIHLPRHTRNVHKTNEGKASHINLLHDQRQKSIRRGKIKYKDYHKRTKCPVDDCYAVVYRLTRHLSTFHHMSPQEQLTKFGSAVDPNNAGDPNQNHASGNPQEPLISAEGAIVSEEDVRLAEDDVEDESDPEDVEDESDSEDTLESKEDDHPGDSTHTREDKNASVERFNKLVADFAAFLGSHLGQELDNGTIEQHVHQLKSLLEFSDIKDGNTRNLFDATVLNDAFVKLRKRKDCGGKTC